MTRAVVLPAEPAHHYLGTLLTRMVREADARIPDGRRARRTLQEMQPGYERQPVLTLYRPEMAEDACPLCGRWNCDPTQCPSVAPAPALAPDIAPATGSGEGQCSWCGTWYPDWNGGICDACQAGG